VAWVPRFGCPSKTSGSGGFQSLHRKKYLSSLRGPRSCTEAPDLQRHLLPWGLFPCMGSCRRQAPAPRTRPPPPSTSSVGPAPNFALGGRGRRWRDCDSQKEGPTEVTIFTPFPATDRREITRRSRVRRSAQDLDYGSYIAHKSGLSECRR
jgi:hypothetical protein